MDIEPSFDISPTSDIPNLSPKSLLNCTRQVSALIVDINFLSGDSRICLYIGSSCCLFFMLVKPIDGRKNGSIDINPKTIDIALNSLKNIGDEEARDYLHYELSKWKNGDFENAVLVHNYVWHMLDGNIGKALSLDTYEVNKIKSKYFK